MTDQPSTGPALSALEQAKLDVTVSLKRFRKAIKQFRSITKKPPYFIMEPEGPHIPADMLRRCQVFPDRRHMLIELLASGGLIAEVGTQYGNWAAEIIEHKEPAELHLFDLTFDRTRDDVKDAPSVKLHLGKSFETMAQMPDNFFDWIYVDADHTYEGVKKDIGACIPKLKDEGILVFNDYLTWAPMLAEPYGVLAAVNELTTQGWEVCGLALARSGYHDIALRKLK